MIASLGMYDFAANTAANDRFWALIRDGLRQRGIAAPDALTRGAAAYWDAWQSPDLVLSQTCGLPFRARLHDQVTLIGTPDYAVAGCPPGYYRSVFIARADDPRGDAAEFAMARFCYNEALSQSGWAAPKAWFDHRGLALTPALATGSHAGSALAVLEGRADFAAIDAVTWALLQEERSWTAGLRVIGQTDPTPGLPLVSAPGARAGALFDAVGAAIDALSPTDRTGLRLKGIVHIPASAYLALPIPAAPEQIAQTV